MFLYFIGYKFNNLLRFCRFVTFESYGFQNQSNCQARRWHLVAVASPTLHKYACYLIQNTFQKNKIKKQTLNNFIKSYSMFLYSGFLFCFYFEKVQGSGNPTELELESIRKLCLCDLTSTQCAALINNPINKPCILTLYFIFQTYILLLFLLRNQI